MSDRLLWVPPWLVSPAGAEAIPASLAILGDYRSRYEIATFEWPCMKGAAKAPPTWQGAVAALANELTAETHVIAMETSVAAAVLALAARPGLVRSATLIGIAIPPATLDSMGLTAIAQAAAAGGRFSGSYTWVRHVMQDNNEGEWRRYAAILDADIDWHYAAEFRASYDSLDLLKESPRVDVPVLMLDKSAATTTFGAAFRKELMEKLVPELELGDVGEWGNHLQNPDSRYLVSQQTLSFTSRYAAASLKA